MDEEKSGKVRKTRSTSVDMDVGVIDLQLLKEQVNIRDVPDTFFLVYRIRIWKFEILDPDISKPTSSDQNLYPNPDPKKQPDIRRTPSKLVCTFFRKSV